jgi:hypothetical protein
MDRSCPLTVWGFQQRCRLPPAERCPPFAEAEGRVALALWSYDSRRDASMCIIPELFLLRQSNCPSAFAMSA